MATFQKVKLGNVFKLEYGKGLIAEKEFTEIIPCMGLLVVLECIMGT